MPTSILTTSTTTNSTTTTPSNPPPTLLSLPIELRLKVYTHILTTSNIHSFRPQRKIGWNRPHADLTNPALLFESDAHVSLKCLFHSRLTKSDHALVLETVLKLARVLVVEHADFVSLVKVVGAGSGAVSISSTIPGHGSPKSLANIVRTHLRTIDFSDRMDEIICQPNDIVKLIKGLPGLRSICLTSRHVQRYSGTVEEHVEFTRERAERETSMGMSGLVQKSGECSNDTDTSTATSTSSTPAETASELRRLTLRSPMTDGNRMMISPALFNRSLSLSQPSTPTTTTITTAKSSTRPTWVVVDLSLLIWQHFLYNGAPYRDHWRTIKMNTLLDVARMQGVDVIMGLRNVEFDPSVLPVSGSGREGRGLGRRKTWVGGSVFRGEMSTRDWVLRLRRGGGGAGGGTEYCVRQRRAFDEVIGQSDLEGGTSAAERGMGEGE